MKGNEMVPNCIIMNFKKFRKKSINWNIYFFQTYYLLIEKSIILNKYFSNILFVFYHLHILKKSLTSVICHISSTVLQSYMI